MSKRLMKMARNVVAATAETALGHHDQRRGGHPAASLRPQPTRDVQEEEPRKEWRVSQVRSGMWNAHTQADALIREAEHLERYVRENQSRIKRKDPRSSSAQLMVDRCTGEADLLLPSRTRMLCEAESTSCTKFWGSSNVRNARRASRASRTLRLSLPCGVGRQVPRTGEAVLGPVVVVRAGAARAGQQPPPFFFGGGQMPRGRGAGGHPPRGGRRWPRARAGRARSTMGGSGLLPHSNIRMNSRHKAGVMLWTGSPRRTSMRPTRWPCCTGSMNLAMSGNFVRHSSGPSFTRRNPSSQSMDPSRCRSTAIPPTPAGRASRASR